MNSNTSNHEPVLRLRGLTKRFGKRIAVNGLSLEVQRGDVYGFLGPNGAGKTTTMRMIVGLIRPSGGQVTIAGEHLTFWHRSPLARLGASIESPAFYGYLSGRDNLRLYANLTAPCPDKRIDAVLDRVGLSSRAQDKVRVYSHGMKQRLAIAAALLPGPDLVLLDEPTNGLDPMGIRDVRELIRSLAHDDEYTIFLSSHLLVEIEQICNRGAIMVEGKKRWEGKVADLLARRRRIRLRATPADRACAALRTRMLERETSEDGDSGEGFDVTQPIRTRPEVIYVSGGVSGRDVTADELVATLVMADCRVHEVMTEVPSLEEVFVELVENRKETGSESGSESASESGSESASASEPEPGPAEKETPGEPS